MAVTTRSLSLGYSTDMTTDPEAGQCEIDGCKRSSCLVVERNGTWRAVCSFHAAPKHWKLKEDFDVVPTLFKTNSDKE